MRCWRQMCTNISILEELHIYNRLSNVDLGLPTAYSDILEKVKTGKVEGWRSRGRSPGVEVINPRRSLQRRTVKSEGALYTREIEVAEF